VTHESEASSSYEQFTKKQTGILFTIVTVGIISKLNYRKHVFGSQLMKSTPRSAHNLTQSTVNPAEDHFVSSRSSCSDQSLFKRVISNKHHVLQLLLPERNNGNNMNNVLLTTTDN